MARGGGSRRGGYRAPARPAAVSGPGALSARTDGGPGNARQPIRVASGGPYGQRQALTGLQAAAPLAAGAVAPGTASAGAVSSFAAPGPRPPQVFGPTERPSEPLSAGLRAGPILPDDPDVLLRALYWIYPHPDILRLMNLT